MKKNELKKVTKTEALKNIDKLKKDLFNFRFQKINSQITNPSKINGMDPSGNGNPSGSSRSSPLN